MKVKNSFMDVLLSSKFEIQVSSVAKIQISVSTKTHLKTLTARMFRPFALLIVRIGTKVSSHTIESRCNLWESDLL
ncbi:hypothetical protein [Portibacter lacus]|uniref:hypothetical protein n=1 Tax=Portibacter lacus TaxID=1099794 RepID=UPI001F29248F|nr:hypothetical protein [Portibacter lacus]